MSDSFADKNSALIFHLLLILKLFWHITIDFLRQMLKVAFRFSQLAKKVPLVNLQAFLRGNNSVSDCKQIREAFHDYGCVIINDPRINFEKNDKFLDLLQVYFSKRQSQLDRGEKEDVYEELRYQVGLTPPYTQKLEDQSETISKFTGQNKSLTPYPNKPLSRMRFFWNVEEVTPDIPSNKIPKDFPQMEHVLNDWGKSTLNTLFTVSEMLALSLGFPKSTFADMLRGGATKLAPNANDLRRVKLGEPFIDFHYDFTYMTIHGKSRFPGLYIWLANGQKIQVSIPKGCLFLQAGSQLEFMTGGYILCGYHEAINTEEVQRLAQQCIKTGKEPWRITSTVFSHLRGDVMLEPIGQFATKEAKEKYGSIKQADYMRKIIDLRQKKPTKSQK